MGFLFLFFCFFAKTDRQHSCYSGATRPRQGQDLEGLEELDYRLVKERGFVKQKPGLHFLKGVFLDKIFKQTLSGEERKAEFQFGKMENILRWMVVMFVPWCECT